VNERINAHVVQARKETDRQGQEITAASSSLLASIREHKEQMGVTAENLNREISKSKEYVDSKFSTISGEIQDIKQHSSAEISRLGATLADLQAKLMTGTSDSTSPAVPIRLDVRSEAVQQVDGVTNTVGSKSALPSVHGVNGCSTSVSNDVNSVINQPNNSCSYGNVNATSELHAKSAQLCELTLPTFSDSTKQVPLHFIGDLDQYFNLRQTPDELCLPLVFRAIQEPFAKQWLSSSFDKLKGYDEFKKVFMELLWNPSRQASIRSSIYLDKYNPNSGESCMDHYIRHANLASTLDPPMTEMNLLSALTSHFETKVQQGMICGDLKNSQDALAFLSKFQGLGEGRKSFRSPKRDYDRRDVSRRTQDNPNRDERQRDRGNNVNVRYVRRQTSRRSGECNSRHQDYQDGRNFNGRAQGRVGEIETSTLNPTVPRFNPREDRPLVGQNTGSDRDHSDNAQNLNN